MSSSFSTHIHFRSTALSCVPLSGPCESLTNPLKSRRTTTILCPGQVSDLVTTVVPRNFAIVIQLLVHVDIIFSFCYRHRHCLFSYRSSHLYISLGALSK